MQFLFRSDSHFNLANLFTFVNIAAGLAAVYFISQNNFFVAIILAWIGGAFDIFDGKIARKFGLSNEFGIQLDSFADFLTFVLVPVFLIFQAVFITPSLALNYNMPYNVLGYDMLFIIAGAISVYYVICGLRRLIQFNIDADVGVVGKYFVGVPSPLGAILLWFVYLGHSYGFVPAEAVLIFMILIGWSLNSTLKVPHP